ncbi:MAG: DUF4440 domain-containing protein [Verrucomicrobiota bacterium]
MTLRFIPILLLTLITLLAADDPQISAVRAADDERVAATLTADRGRLTALFSDDLRYAHSTGMVDTKATLTETIVSGRTKYEVIRYEERNFTIPAPGIALMAGRANFKTTNAKGTADVLLSFLSVWRFEQGQWRFLAWQSSKIPAPTEDTVSNPAQEAPKAIQDHGAGALAGQALNPKQAADRVLAGLFKVTAPEVKGAHDAEFACVGDRAYIVAEVNDEKASESAGWPIIYSALSIVDLKTLAVVKTLPFAKSGQAFENETLPTGACFVPRIIQKDARTVRCYFASEAPTKRQSQTWFLDFNIERMEFEKQIHRAKLKTDAGVFDLQPQYFHADTAAHGFKRPAKDFGLYLFDSFKTFDGKTYVALNNYPGGQNALAMANEALDTFEIVGHYNEPFDLNLTESAVNRLPDGTWMAICRQEGGNRNYTFTTSKDGKTWSRGEHRDFVPNGSSSKPTFDKFRGVYYLGWQESTRINGVGRSVFNLDISRDGKTWERKYRFETGKSFQYPTFHEHHGSIWLAVTQGDTDSSRKERIMFGKLE